MLLDKRNFNSLVSGDGACLGCAEKTVMHLFTATVEALMRPRVAKQVTRLDDLIAKLEQHIQLKLVADMKVGDGIDSILGDASGNGISLSESRLSRSSGALTRGVSVAFM